MYNNNNIEKMNWKAINMVDNAFYAYAGIKFEDNHKALRILK